MKILTFDIEDWFHILDNPATNDVDNWVNLPSRIERGVDRILDMLDSTNSNATFFCLGWVAENHPNIIKKISNRGHQIGTHSYSHQLAYSQTKDEYEEDLRKSIFLLEDLIGTKIDLYRAPGFSITKENLWAFEVLHSCGINIDCSVFPAGRAHGGLPEYGEAKPSLIKFNNIELKSLPINTSNFLSKQIIYSGGGYFRLLPLHYLKKRFYEDNYIMTYFHPRDFDINQPMIPGLNAYRKFKCYVGIKGAQKKLTYLLENNDFVDIKTAENLINWEKVNTVNLDHTYLQK